MTFTLEVCDQIATITLNRPEVRNALTAAIVEDLADAVIAGEADDDVRVFVITGADPAFCAGFDLRNMAGEDRDAQRARLRPLDDRFRSFPPHHKPIIGAVNGAAVTGDFIDATRAYQWGLVTEVVPHEQLLARAHEIAHHIANVPARNIAALREQYDDVTARLGEDAWNAENARSRAWMSSEFDQERLRAVRAVRTEIIERGRGRGRGRGQR